jgi:hypothetical protein
MSSKKSRACEHQLRLLILSLTLSPAISYLFCVSARCQKAMIIRIRATQNVAMTQEFSLRMADMNNAKAKNRTVQIALLLGLIESSLSLIADQAFP